jgi:predicted DNA binding CopG/RHH family protein
MKKNPKKEKPLSESDYTEYIENTDFGAQLSSGELVPVNLNFNLKAQDRLISIRLSSELIELLKQTAKKHKTKYQKLIRAILEENIVHYL